MTLLVRVLAILAFTGQVAFLFFNGSRDLESAPFLAILSLPLLIPLFARSSKPRSSVAFLVAFVPAALGTIWVLTDSFSATNSTAALGLLLLPFVQCLFFIPALVLGRSER